MLYNGEQHRRRLAAGGRHRRRPARGHDAHRARACPTRWPSSRWPSAARCSTRARASTWRSSPAAPTSPTCSTSTARWARRCGSSPSAAASTSATSWSSCSTARATRRASTRSATPARACASSPTATSARRCSRSATARRSTCCGASAARPRASSPRRAIKCIGGELVGRLWPRDDDERQAALDARLRPRPQLTHDDLVSSRRLLLLRDRRHRRRRAPGRALPRHAPRDDGVARHALALGHGAPRPAPRTTARSCARSRRPSATAERGAARRSRVGARGGGACGSGTSSIVGEAPDLATRRGRAGRGERRKPWRDEHVDARLRVRVEPAADRATRSPGRSSRPRPRRGCARGPASSRGAALRRRSPGSRRRRGRAGATSTPRSMRQRTMPRSPSISYSGAWKVSSSNGRKSRHDVALALGVVDADEPERRAASGSASTCARGARGTSGDQQLVERAPRAATRSAALDRAHGAGLGSIRVSSSASSRDDAPLGGAGRARLAAPRDDGEPRRGHAATMRGDQRRRA